MLHKLLGAAAMAAAAYAFVPAHAAAAGPCSGDSQAKAQGHVDSMADGPAKYMAEREIAHAQTAFLAGNLNQCAMHLSNAMSAGAGPYPGAYAQAPYPGGPYAEAPGPYAEAPGPYAEAPGPYTEAPGPYAAEEAPYPHTYAAPPPGPYHQGPSPYVNTMGPPRY